MKKKDNQNSEKISHIILQYDRSVKKSERLKVISGRQPVPPSYPPNSYTM